MTPRVALMLVGVLAAGALPLAASAQPAPAATQPRVQRGVIDGIVTDTSMNPLAGATAQVLGSEVTVTTGTNGRFRIVGLPPGDHVVAVRRIGYAQFVSLITVVDGDTLRPSFALERFEQLGTVVVKAKPVATRMAEFESRKAAGFGYYLDQAKIDSLKKSYPSDLLNQFNQFIYVRGATAYNRRGSTHGMAPFSYCAFEVFVDGQPLGQPVDINSAPRPSDLAGVEIYPGAATVPLEYKRLSGGAMCGVILFWTRVGP